MIYTYQVVDQQDFVNIIWGHVPSLSGAGEHEVYDLVLVWGLSGACLSTRRFMTLFTDDDEYVRNNIGTEIYHSMIA